MATVVNNWSNASKPNLGKDLAKIIDGEAKLYRDLHNATNEAEEYQLKSKHEKLLTGPDRVATIQNKSKTYIYCNLCMSELKRKKDVECDLNPGFFKMRYHCEFCDLDYWGMSIDKLVLSKDNKTKPIVETYSLD